MSVLVNAGAVLRGREQAEADRLKANSPTPRPQLVCTRGNFAYGGIGAGARNDTRFESSLLVSTCKSRVGNIQLIYSGIYANANEESTNLLTQYTLESAVVQNGVLTPITFGGRLRPIIDAGATLVISDPVGVSLAPESLITLRSGAIVAAGERVPAGVRGGGGATVKVASTSATSQVYSTSAIATPSGGTTTTTTIAPLAVIGVPEVATPSVMIWGDSIPHGVGDNSDFSTGLIGYAERALGALKIPFVQVGRGGDQTSAYGGNKAWVRFALMQYCSHVLLTMGSNDIAGGTTLSTLQTYYRAAFAAARRANCKIIVASCPTRTTSADSWATLENQTIVAGFGDDELRGQLNAWFLTAQAAGEFDEFFDFTDGLITGGQWNAGMSDDGIHPNNAGHAIKDAQFRELAAKLTV